MSSTELPDLRNNLWSHPDLPADATRFMRHDRTASRSSWRAQWLARSSSSSRSDASSLCTSRSASTSTKGPHGDFYNVYQLPLAPQSLTLNPNHNSNVIDLAVPNMRYVFMDETFDFPLPVAKLVPTQTSRGRHPAQPKSRRSLQSDVKSIDSMLSQKGSTASKTSSSTSKESRSWRERLSLSIDRPSSTTRDATVIKNEVEIEMATEQQSGYWTASFPARMPATSGLCGALLLLMKLPHGHVIGRDISSTALPLRNAEAKLSLALRESISPEEVIRRMQSLNLASAVLLLKTGLDMVPPPGIPHKVFMGLYKKAKGLSSQERRKMFPSMVKVLKKMPQDRLVLLIFLTSIARRLERAQVSIDGEGPADYLLRSVWPTDLAVADSARLVREFSRLLIAHFDEIPRDFPTVLAALNYRFANGKRYNLLTAMENERHEATQLALAECRYLQLEF